MQYKRYAEYRAVAIPQGSGVTEAACKTVYTQRLKLSGMSWKKAGARSPEYRCVIRRSCQTATPCSVEFAGNALHRAGSCGRESGTSSAEIRSGAASFQPDWRNLRCPGHRCLRKRNVGSVTDTACRRKAGERARGSPGRGPDKGPAYQPECRARIHRLRAVR